MCRVEGRGPATIIEVAFSTKYLTSEEQQDVKQKQSEIRKKLDNAKNLQAVLKQKRVRLEKQRQVLDGFADNAIKGTGIKVRVTEMTTVLSFTFL